MAIRPGMNSLTSPPPPVEEEPMMVSAPAPRANQMPPAGTEPPEGDPAGDASLESRMFQKMIEAGMNPDDPQLQSMDPVKILQMGIDRIWRRSPTDENAELIEQISGRYGIATPWGQKELPYNNPDGSQTARGIQSNLDSMHDTGGWTRGDTPAAEKYTRDLVGPLYRANKMRQNQKNNALTK